MTKRDKLIRKVLDGKNISSDEADKVLAMLGFTLMNQRGSHKTYAKANNDHITIVANQKRMLDYQLKQLQEAISNV